MSGPALPLITGLAQIADRADAFILDLWGVIHDGVEAYAGAADTLRALRAAGKTTLMLSNAPRRADALVEQLGRLGVARDLYDHVLSSGEAVHLELAARTDPVFAALGRTLYHLGPERDENVFAGLDYTAVDLDHADFVLNTGPWDFDDSVGDYDALLARALDRNLPMVCANPDLTVMRQGKPIICAGALAARYQDRGGRVTMRGKPDAAIYAQALALLGVPAARVMAVGDALHTDIRGAHAGGLAGAVLVTQGVHAGELGIRPGEVPEAAALDRLVARFGDQPVAAIRSFLW